MLFLKIRREDAELARRKLLERKLLLSAKASREEGFVYFPIEKNPGFKEFKYELVEREGELGEKGSLKERLEHSLRLDEKEASSIFSSYEVIGSIALLEIPSSLRKYRRRIAGEVLKLNKQVKTVLEKKGGRKGPYRVLQLAWVAGGRKTETLYKENNCVFKLDLRKVYFSTRLGFERERISKLVKDNEKVMVFFAGVMPFAIVIAKKNASCEVKGIELNEAAVKYAKENIALNKLSERVEVIKGDVKKVSRKFNEWADRTILPLPHSSIEFIREAVSVTKPNGMIHFYFIAREEEGKEIIEWRDCREMASKIREECKRKGRTLVVQNARIARPFASRVHQVVIDLKV